MTAAPAPRTTGARVDLVAVVASAGGVEALKVFLSLLPADLPACVLVALHLPKDARSVLTEILRRVSGPAVALAQDGVLLEPGLVLVAPPDNHLLVRDGRVLLGRGPTENGHRPSHDAMLRAVALEAGPRAVGVVLTGLLDDGAAGLAAVHRYGGRCFVQDPDDADFPSMPLAALEAVPDARRAPLAALAHEVVLATEDDHVSDVPDVSDSQRVLDVVEVRSAERGTPQLPDGSTPGTPSQFSCPDCHGVLNGVPDHGITRFRCRTGHAWTAESLAAVQQEQVEEALWVALRVLEERADLSHRLSEQAVRERRDWSGEHHARRAQEAGRSAALIRGVLARELTDGSPPTGPAVAGATVAPVLALPATYGGDPDPRS